MRELLQRLRDREDNGGNTIRLAGTDRHELSVVWSLSQAGLGLDAFRDTQDTAVGLQLGPFWVGYHGWRSA